MPVSFRIIGPGRAGGSFAAALQSVGWTFEGSLGKGDDLGQAASGTEVVLICVPDAQIGPVAHAVQPGEAAMLHVSGASPVSVLGGEHRRIGSVHPLMTMPDAKRGAARLLDQCRFAVAGDEAAVQVVEALGGVSFPVPDAQRAAYHAAAAVASNHLVALAAHVERLARLAGVPPEAYWPLMTASLENAIGGGPAAALTGPASRGDWDTVGRHLGALSAAEPRDLDLYLALAEEAANLAGHQLPLRLKQSRQRQQEKTEDLGE